MTDPSFLLQSSAAKDLVELARDLQALLDIRTAAMQQPLSGIDIDFSSFAAGNPSSGNRPIHLADRRRYSSKGVLLKG